MDNQENNKTEFQLSNYLDKINRVYRQIDFTISGEYRNSYHNKTIQEAAELYFQDLGFPNTEVNRASTKFIIIDD